MSLSLVLRQFCLLSMHPDEQLALLLLVYHPEKKKKKVLLQKKDCWLMPGKLTEWSSRVALRTGENQDRFQLARATITEYHRPDGLNN